MPTNVANHNFPQSCMQYISAIFLDMSNFPFLWARDGMDPVTLLLEKPSEEQRGWSGVSRWQQGVKSCRPCCPLLVITWNRTALKSCRCWPSPWPETHTDFNSLRKRCGCVEARSSSQVNYPSHENCCASQRKWGCSAFNSPAFWRRWWQKQHGEVGEGGAGDEL